MGMKLADLSGSAEPQPLMDVNTTPLIDVMLVLLVMLILTIPVQLHSMGLRLGGEPASKDAPKPVVHVVSVDFDGSVYWNDQRLADRAALDARMQAVGALAVAAQPEVHIKPNRLADYGAFAAVVASAQSHSVRKMGVVGNEHFHS